MLAARAILPADTRFQSSNAHGREDAYATCKLTSQFHLSFPCSQCVRRLLGRLCLEERLLGRCFLLGRALAWRLVLAASTARSPVGFARLLGRALAWRLVLASSSAMSLAGALRFLSERSCRGKDVRMHGNTSPRKGEWQRAAIRTSNLLHKACHIGVQGGHPLRRACYSDRLVINHG